MNRKTSIALIAAFLLLLTLPHAVSPFLSNARMLVARQENRNITPFPDSFVWRKIFSELEAYYNDRIPFRRSLLELCHRFQRKLFPRIHKNSLIGKDGFIFLCADSWENTFEQYTGRTAHPVNHYYQSEILKRMISAQKQAQRCGAEFLMVVPPNKINVYPDKLPEKRAYGKSPEYFMDQLVERGRRCSPKLNLLYLEDALRKDREKISYPIYYAQDTHWNDIGAYCGFCAMLKELNLPLPPGWSTPEKAVVKAADGTKCDLLGFLGLADSSVKPMGDDRYYTVVLPASPVRETVIKKRQYLVTENPKAIDPREIVVFHDSFMIAMGPYFSAYFRKVHFYWSEYRPAIVEKYHPQLVIFERIARAVPFFYRRRWE